MNKKSIVKDVERICANKTDHEEKSKNESRRKKIRNGMMRYQQKMLICRMIKFVNLSIEEIQQCLNKIA